MLRDPLAVLERITRTPADRWTIDDRVIAGAVLAEYVAIVRGARLLVSPAVQTAVQLRER